MAERKPIHHIVAGLLIALAVVMVSIILSFIGGASAGAGGGWLTFLIIIAGLVFFVQRYGRDIDYQATFGDYFNYGFKATTMIVLLYVVYLVVLSLAVPDVKQMALDGTRAQLERAKATDAEIDKVMGLTSRNFWVLLIGTSVFFFAFIGAIGSLIGAAITKKEPKDSSSQSTF